MVVQYYNDKKSAILFGTVKQLREGTGSAAGKLIKVIFDVTKYDKASGSNKVVEEVVNFWNNDDPSKFQGKDRLLKAKVKIGSVLMIQASTTEHENVFTGFDFKYCGGCYNVDNEGSITNIVLGRACNIKESDDGTKLRFSVPVNEYVEGENRTKWVSVTAINSNNNHSLKDRAKKCIFDKQIYLLVLSEISENEGSDGRTYNNALLFRFEIPQKIEQN